MSQDRGEADMAKGTEETTRTREMADEQVLDALRRAAADVGTPISAERYEHVWRDYDGVSSARLVQRFGSWNAACTAAGLPTNPGRTAYRRSWTADQLVAAVADYLRSDGASGSYAGYDEWSRAVPGAPSANTVRNNLKGWANAKAGAQALIERDGG